MNGIQEVSGSIPLSSTTILTMQNRNHTKLKTGLWFYRIHLYSSSKLVC